MIVKIFKAAKSFAGVNYNERKNENLSFREQEKNGQNRPPGRLRTGRDRPASSCKAPWRGSRDAPFYGLPGGRRWPSGFCFA